MYARHLALVCLLYVSTSTGWGQFLGDGAVAVYLKAGNEHSSSSLNEMKAELDVLMRSVGVEIDWWDPRKEAAGRTGDIVVLELRGVCDAPHRITPAQPLENLASLGSSAVADGRILPFSWVDCSALNRFIGNAVADLPAPQRDYMYGRAMARLAAHELYHVLSQKTEHAQTGIAKAQFTGNDLLANHFEFEPTVLAKARRVHNPDSASGIFGFDGGGEK